MSSPTSTSIISFPLSLSLLVNQYLRKSLARTFAILRPKLAAVRRRRLVVVWCVKNRVLNSRLFVVGTWALLHTTLLHTRLSFLVNKCEKSQV
jgi:hypothetical protein